MPFYLIIKVFLKAKDEIFRSKKYKMINRFWLFLSFVFSLQLYAQNSQILLADPTIFEENGTYYLYGTKEDHSIPGEGFLVYTSKNLKTWEGPLGKTDGYALKKGDAFGTRGFWAPQVFKQNGHYYMAYTANENIAIASANSPLGPFKNKGKALEATVKQIDPFVFFDDGKVYLYHVRLTAGNRIFVAEMTEDLSAIKPETLKECIAAKETWENTTNAEWPVSEGPTVFRNAETYIMLYSVNDFRNPDYSVGVATAKSPFGPWKKSASNPLISTADIGRNGPGHGDLFKNRNTLYYVLHTHFSQKKVSPRKTAIVKLKFDKKKNVFKLKSHSFQDLKK
jgi:beta-xylosidase